METNLYRVRQHVYVLVTVGAPSVTPKHLFFFTLEM